jgi:DNA-binding NarL/FixJ family response regulator
VFARNRERSNAEREPFRSADPIRNDQAQEARMDAATRAELSRRLERHYARFDHDKRALAGRHALATLGHVEADVRTRRALSARELAVLGHIADGMTDRQIARQLTLGEQTVKTYVRNILAKLDAHNRAHAVAIGVRHGLIRLETGTACAA